MRLENLTLIISFIAILVGIVGKTWDNKRKGIKKLRPTGWLTVVIGLTTCAIGIYKNHQNQSKFNWQEQQKARIKKIAYNELDNSLNNLLRPFGVLWENTQFKFKDTADIERFYKDDDYRFKHLTSPIFMLRLDSFDFNSKPEYPDADILWGNWFSENAGREKNNLNELWLKFNLYYDAETVLQIDSILNDDFFTMRLIELPDLIKANQHMKKYYISYAFVKAPDKDIHYLIYMDKLRRLKETATKLAKQ